MKRIILLLTIMSASFVARAQVNNFYVADNNKLYWQNIYETSMNYDEIIRLVLSKKKFNDVTWMNGVITCRIVRDKVDAKSMGYDIGAVPMYVVTRDFSSSATIQVKDGRYRVTVDNIVLTTAITGGTFREGETSTIETWAVRNGKITSGFAKKPSIIYNDYLLELFDLNLKDYISNEW